MDGTMNSDMLRVIADMLEGIDEATGVVQLVGVAAIQDTDGNYLGKVGFNGGNETTLDEVVGD